MEEDDEIQSQQSPETGSPALSSSPPRPNGRITVTVASAPPQPQSQTQPPQHKTLTLALPIQPRNNGGGGGSGGGGGREDCWSEGATSVLIEAWGDRYLELSRGNLKQKHWKEVADIVSGREDYTKTPKTPKTDIQCKNRIDTVKKKYKLEKQKIATGAGPSKWPFFERLDHLIGPTAKIAGVVMNNTPPAASQKVPLGIPVGIGVRYNNNQPKPLQVVSKNSGQRILHQEQQQQFRKRDVGLELESDSEADSMDSLPPPLPRPPKRARNRMMVMGKVEESGKMRGGGGGGGEGEGGGWGNAVKELTQAILRFGEAYEQAENAKLLQVVDMEKQRMKFAKELELQRMQFFMNTQMEISQLRRKSGGGSGSNHHSNNNINNSDCSN